MRRNVALINLYTICTNLVFVLPVVVPYYKEIGLSFQDFLIGEAMFAGVVLLAEVPSGWISDVWKRRSTLMLGGFFGMLGYSVLLVADSLWEAVLAQGIIGIAVALNSGTVTALLYDSLLEEERVEEFRRLEGQRHAITLYSVAASALAGSLMYAVDFRLPVFMDVIALFFGMVAIAFVREPKRHHLSVEKHIFHDMWVTMKYALSGHPEITGIILVSTVILSATKLMMWSQQPYYEMVGIGVEWFGAIMAGSYVVGGLAGHWSHRIEHIGTNRAALGVTAAVLTVACFMLVLFPSAMLAIPMFLTGTLAYGTISPRIQNAINKRVGSARRATILSTAGLMVHLLFIPSSLIVGHIAEKTDVMDSILFVGGLIAVLSAIGLFLWSKNKEVAA